jgi:hypothetical protein
MPFQHQTGVYNVQSSLIAWLNAQLNSDPPPTTGPLTLVIDHPDEPVRLPQVSIHFLRIDPDPVPVLGQQVGGGTGLRRFGAAEIDCWVSRQEAHWRAQLLQMQDRITQMVLGLRAAGSSIPIYDFYADPAEPPLVAARIFIGTVEQRRPPFDPNPAVERKRLVLHFWWVERGD